MEQSNNKDLIHIKEKYNTPRYKYGFDLLFSYWTFAWYILFMFGVLTTSPKLTLIIETIFIVIWIILLIHNKTHYKKKLSFTIVQVFIKIIPLLTLINIKINFYKEIKILIILFITYLIWLYINNTNIYEIYPDAHSTPALNLINYVLMTNY